MREREVKKGEERKNGKSERQGRREGKERKGRKRKEPLSMNLSIITCLSANVRSGCNTIRGVYPSLSSIRGFTSVEKMRRETKKRVILKEKEKD